MQRAYDKIGLLIVNAETAKMIFSNGFVGSFSVIFKSECMKINSEDDVGKLVSKSLDKFSHQSLTANRAKCRIH
jgi:hypothetical protein